MTLHRALALFLLLAPSSGCDAAPGCDPCVDAAPVSDVPVADASAPDDAAHPLDAGTDAFAEADAFVADAATDDAGAGPERWHVETVATGVGPADLVPSLALEGDAAAIGWFDGALRRGRVALRGADGWSTETVEDVAFSGVSTNVAFDASGGVRAAFHRLSGPNLVYAERDEAGSWALTTLFPDQALGFNARARGVGDVMHVVAMNDSAPRGVTYVRGDGTDWSREAAYLHGATGEGGTMPVGIAVVGDRVYSLLIREVVSLSLAQAILAERAPDGTWTSEVVDEHVFAAVGYAGLAVGPDGGVHVCLNDDAAGFVVASRDAAGDWTRETLDASTVQQPCALGVGGDGRVHLVHSLSSLLHRVSDGASWSPDVRIDASVEAPIDVRLDASDRPHVAYLVRTGTHGDVRYAWLGP